VEYSASYETDQRSGPRYSPVSRAQNDHYPAGYEPNFRPPGQYSRNNVEYSASYEIDQRSGPRYSPVSRAQNDHYPAGYEPNFRPASPHQNPIYRAEKHHRYSAGYETDYRPAGHRSRDDVSFSASFENNRDESTSFSDSDDVSARTAARNLARIEHEVDNIRNQFPGAPIPNVGRGLGKQKILSFQKLQRLTFWQDP